MTVPRLLVLTDRTQCADPLIEVIRAAIEAGARAIVLREKDLPEEERDHLSAQVRELLAPVGGLLVRAGAVARGGAGGLHLAADDPFPADRPSLVGRSCHSAPELRAALAEGCDYATISPVFATASKPGYGPALGLGGLATLAGAGPPAYALGGVHPADVRGCLTAGAHGVAAMGALMRDPHLVSAYLAELEETAA